MRFKDSVQIFQHRMGFELISQLYSTFDLAICMRFHSHIFAIMSGLPFLSLCISPKVEKVCQELGPSYERFIYRPPRISDWGYPVAFDSKRIADCFDELCSSQEAQEAVINLSKEWKESIQPLPEHVRSLFMYGGTEFKKRNTAPYAIFPKQDEDNRMNAAKMIVRMLMTKTFLEDRPVNVEDLARAFGSGDMSFETLVNIATESVLDDRDKKTQNKETLGQITTRIICFAITGQSFPSYFYGLKQQIWNSDFNLKDSWDWIIRDWAKTKPDHRQLEQLEQNIFPLKFDLHTLEQKDFGGVHRSGWQYVVDHLYGLDDHCPVIMDTYLDKTFGWDAEFYNFFNIIPFKRPWVGFIHHTFAEHYSNNNAKSLLHSPLFIQSLSTCRGIFVLSQDLKTKVSAELKLITDNPPDINVLFHPTEIPVNELAFSMKSFLSNRKKKLIQVGAWLRDSYAIYRVPIDPSYKNPLKIQKAALKGKRMENYFRPKRAYVVLTSNPEEEKTVAKMALCNCKCTCRPETVGITPGCNVNLDEVCSSDKESLPNKYMHGLLHCIEDNHRSVRLIERLSNKKYDELMTKNLIFVHLVDCSAANTLIESIVRCTPVFITTAR